MKFLTIPIPICPHCQLTFPSMWLRWEVEVKERGFCMKSTTKHCIHQAYSQWRTDRPEHPFRLGRTTQCTWPLPPGHGQGGFKTQITFIFTGSQTAQFKLKYGKTLIKCHLVWIDNHIPAILKNRSINDLAREVPEPHWNCTRRVKSVILLFGNEILS